MEGWLKEGMGDFECLLQTGEAESGSVLLIGNKRIKNRIYNIVGNATAGITAFNDNRIIFPVSAEKNGTAVSNCILP